MTKKRPTILIIDDDERIRYTVQEICNFQGWDALLAAGYAQAREHLKHRSADLMLVDYHLPVMDGIRIVRELRKEYVDTPVIVLTIEEQEKVMQRFMEAGADDYALKPIKAVDLVSRIRMHLKYAQQKQYYGNTKKGINEKTLQRITQAMAAVDGYVDIEDIERATAISQKSIYRYLQHLIDEGRVLTHSDYGKVGRPRTTYRLKGDGG